ncbi:alpha/beta hydrolase [Solimonas sp. K1W22B-7]|uniref:alpha/beta fold hydrolase n=1 Tax=Solimonas sp. K1W22B-7 TaxID=2303331 RepID=UPI000E33394B|nr:alpha/beta hydrolase [Solimonas sp. K1W22B-7]AXQ27790.1 alpha/beta hydrolase [Solimonas sp. K1W22B-7]
MPTLPTNGYDLAYAEAGSGRPVLLIHGSLCDYRYWAPQMQPLGERGRAIAVSLRRCWPEAWDGQGEGYSIEQHVDDLAAFIEALDAGPVDLVGHSRGGHVAFRLALRAPQWVRKLVLAEPGGLPDASLGEIGGVSPEDVMARTREAAQRIAAGDIDGGLAYFIDSVSGTPIWKYTVQSFKTMARANAKTLLGQVRETRMAFTRADLEALKLPTLLVGGELTPPPFPQLLDLLQANIAGARRVTIPGARHAMNLAAPARFNAAVLGFLS